MSTPGFADSPPKPRPSPSVAAAPQGFGDKPPGFGAKPPASFGDAPPATSGFADTPPTDSKPPPGQSGLFSVNPGVNVVGDYMTEWTKYGAGGIRQAFRTVVDGLANTFHLGIYDFNKGHHNAPNDPHLDGRAMDVDTIDGEQVGDKLTPTIRSYITTALATPNVRVGVPKTIYDSLPASQKARAFVDSAGHVHTELAQVMPGQTVAPAGFKPNTAKGFVKDPQAKPASQTQFGAKPPQLPASTFAPQPQANDPETGKPYPPTVQETVQMVHSGLMEMAGHQDLPFILANALMRDNMNLPSPKTINEQWHNPNSNVYKAWELYKKDPGQAMDEYGLGSPAQDQYMSAHGSGDQKWWANLMLKHAGLNALTTFGGEQVNPMALAEGALGGKVLDVGADAARALGLDRVAQGAAKGVGMGSPLFDLRTRGGVEASQWAKATISKLNAPHMALHLPSNGEINEAVFGGLTPEAQSEVVRLKQGLKPNPKFSEPASLKSYKLYRYQNAPGEAQFSPGRTATFYAIGEPGGPADAYRRLSNEAGVGGTHLIQEEYAPVKPLDLGTKTGSVGLNVIRRFYGDEYASAINKSIRAIAAGEAGSAEAAPADALAAQLGIKDWDRVSTSELGSSGNAMLDRLGSEVARKRGYDAVIMRGRPLGGTDQFAKLHAPGQEPHAPMQPTPDLAQRAKLLGDDMGKVEAHQERTGILPPNRKFNTKKFFPMKNSYDFGPQAELEQELKGEGAPGAGVGLSQHKVHADLDESIRSGTLDKDFLPAENYNQWRRQRLQRVSFEDSINRAPASIRRNVVASDFHNQLGVPLSQPWQQNINHSVQETLDRWISENNAKYPKGHPENYDLNENPQWVAAKNLIPDPSKSPALAKSMIAPEMWQFLRGNKGLQRYISSGGTSLPGQEQTWVGKYVAAMRNMIISNFAFHPTVNIAGNDAVARGIYNLGGPQFGRGGYAANAARALALQAGVIKPETFVAGAHEYAGWVDRAMEAGGLAEFGEAHQSALGGDYARVATVPSKRWIDRADKALTKAGDFNRERTFGQKGEQAFAVSLFKDAVQKGGMSDAQAGEMVRQSLGDYYNFDPKSRWSSFFFFMPWLKGNMKFWANTLIRRPQYVTATPHALRNYGLEESPESYQGAYPTGDFTTYGKSGTPYTMPFVGRDIGHVAQMGAQAIKGDVLGAVTTGEQMMAGRATPPVRLATDTLATINAAFSSDVKGPETDWNMVVNPKAPHDVQLKQAAGYFSSHLVPIPLFTYAIQDAVRRGMTPSDLGQALITAGGGGYFGQAKLDAFDKRQLKKAQTKYKKAYDNYRYNDFGDAYLKDAWNTYTAKLKDIGVINQ